MRNFGGNFYPRYIKVHLQPFTGCRAAAAHSTRTLKEIAVEDLWRRLKDYMDTHSRRVGYGVPRNAAVLIRPQDRISWVWGEEAIAPDRQRALLNGEEPGTDEVAALRHVLLRLEVHSRDYDVGRDIHICTPPESHGLPRVVVLLGGAEGESFEIFATCNDLGAAWEALRRHFHLDCDLDPLPKEQQKRMVARYIDHVETVYGRGRGTNTAPDIRQEFSSEK